MHRGGAARWPHLEIPFGGAPLPVFTPPLHHSARQLLLASSEAIQSPAENAPATRVSHTSRTLYVHPHPSVLLERAISTITPGQEIIVPNAKAGSSVQRQLRHHVRLRTLTQAARATLAAHDWRLLKPFEVGRHFQLAIDGVTLNTLRPILYRPGMLAEVFGVCTELLRAHVLPDRLLAIALPGREEDVALIYAAYHAHCLATSTFSAAGSEHFAALLERIVERQAFVYGYAYVDAAQVAFLHRLLSPGSAITLPIATPEGASPRIQRTAATLVAAGFTMMPLHGIARTAGDHALATFDDQGHAKHLLRLEASDIESEVRRGLQQVVSWLGQGIQAEDIAIVIRNEDLYLPVLADIADEYHVPLLSGQMCSLASTPVGNVMFAWLAAIRDRWSFEATSALLTHPLLTWPFDAVSCAQQLATGRPPGIRPWSTGLDVLVIPAATSWPDMLARFEQFLDLAGIHNACRNDPVLTVAINLLLQRLRSEASDPRPLTRNALVNAMSDAVFSTTLPTLLSRHGVQLVNPIGAVGRTFRRVWMAGLSDTIFPAVRSDNPLIDAHIRERWSRSDVHVPDVGQLAAVEDALFRQGLATAQEEILLSRPQRDMNAQQLAPSSFWIRIPGGVHLQEAPVASQTELDVGRCLHGVVPRKWWSAVQVERERTAALATVHTHRLTEGFDIHDHLWTLSDLVLATRCRARWFAEGILGLGDQTPPILDTLRRLAAQAALQGTDVSPVAAVRRAARALSCPPGGTDWFHGPEDWWISTRYEILAEVRRSLRDPAFRPAGCWPIKLMHSRTATVRAGSHRFRLQLDLDRVDHTPSGTVLTLYRAATGGAGLSDDGQLALLMASTGAQHARTYDLATQQSGSVLHHVERPGSDSPLTVALRVLSDLGDDLEAGRITPHPDRYGTGCDGCPLTTTCRARHASGTA